MSQLPRSLDRTEREAYSVEVITPWPAANDTDPWARVELRESVEIPSTRVRFRKAVPLGLLLLGVVITPIWLSLIVWGAYLLARSLVG